MQEIAMNRLALIVDATNWVTTCFMAIPANADPRSVATGLAAAVKRFVLKHSPEQVSLVFDGPGRSFRHDLMPAYKAGRPPKPDALTKALDESARLSRELGQVYRIPNWEADDVIATLTKRLVDDGFKVVVSSRDKDMLQLLAAGRVTVLHRFPDEFVCAGTFTEQHGLRPDQWADYLAIAGDNTDKWPGAKGVGKETARKLLAAFGDIEGIMDAIVDWPHSLTLSRHKIRLNMTQAYSLRHFDVAAARAITRLRSDVPLEEFF